MSEVDSVHYLNFVQKMSSQVFEIFLTEVPRGSGKFITEVRV